MKYEYKAVYSEIGISFANDLNVLFSDGWEYVGGLHSGDGYRGIAVLRRLAK
jgi:hypothetical protein